MPGSPVAEDIEITIEDIGGGGGQQPPAGDDGGDDENGQGRRPSSPARRYYTAVTLGIVSILMFFLALTVAYLARRTSGSSWVPLHLPPVLWANTSLLLASSWSMQSARRHLARSNLPRFRHLWQFTTVLGCLFLVGQVVAWRQLVAQGVYVASNAASGFFYIFTAAHGLHLLGGICALFYVLTRNFDPGRISRAAAAQVTSYYWHFLDGLWIFLLALLYLGR